LDTINQELNDGVNEDAEETFTESISDFFPQAHAQMRTLIAPTVYVPTGPMAPKDSNNRPQMLEISPVNWGIITALFALVILVGILIGIISCISLVCLPPTGDWKPEPKEPLPKDACGRLGYYIKSFFRIPNWRTRLLPLFFGVFFFGFAGYVNIAANIYVQNVMIGEKMAASPPLRDIGFSMIPYIPWEAGVNICMTSLIVIALLNTFFWQKLSGTIVVFRRHILIHGFIFLIRSISISSTILPNPDSTCRPQQFGNFFHATFLFLAGQVETCYDCLFSGHAVTMVLSTLIFFQYTKNLFLRWLLFVPLGFSLLLIIATRFHYTVDVFYGTIIALLFFNLYHYLIAFVKDKLCRGETFEEHTLFMRVLVSWVIWYESWEHLKGKDSKLLFE